MLTVKKGWWLKGFSSSEFSCFSKLLWVREREREKQTNRDMK